MHLIDVREKQELVETGVLPNSVNVPCRYSAVSIQIQPRVKFRVKERLISVSNAYLFSIQRLSQIYGFNFRVENLTR